MQKICSHVMIHCRDVEFLCSNHSKSSYDISVSQRKLLLVSVLCHVPCAMCQRVRGGGSQHTLQANLVRSTSITSGHLLTYILLQPSLSRNCGS